MLAAAVLAAAAAVPAAAAPGGGRAVVRAASVSPSCVPSALGRSALLGGLVTVSPLPDSRDASPYTQISLLGVAPSALSAVTVTGSRSGPHPGRLLAYSQGDGASFVPTHAFTPGETVTVHLTATKGGAARALSYEFDVSVPDTSGEPAGSAQASHAPAAHQSFRSRPELQPPTVDVTTHAAAASPGELLLAPYAGLGQWGPMILGEDGSLLWFDPLPKGGRAADLRVQEYEGRPVLTWWQDPLDTPGDSQAGIVIENGSYQRVAVVRAGNGYQADLHEFQITPRNTALVTVYAGIDCDLSSVGGPDDSAIADTLVEELDLATGLVRWEWHSVDHVPLAASYSSPRSTSRGTPFDFFHVNSVDVMNDGSYLIDSRNTWAAYDLDPRTGQVIWQLGGRHSSFALGPGAAPAFQHDARQQPNGDITFFDNGGTPKVQPQSRAIELALDLQTKTATLVHSDPHSPALLAASQGDTQLLADGDWMVGWGQEPFLTEYSPAGQVLFDAHLPAGYQSYRVFREPWGATPAVPPVLAAVRSGSRLTVYASWNGATNVAAWRLLAGSSRGALAPVATVAKAGFQTTIVATGGPYVEVQALDASGNVIGTSATDKP